MITGAQVRAARGFLGWPARALAKKADVPDFILEWIEGDGRISGKDSKALAAIQAELEAAGVKFTHDRGIPGVQLHPSIAKNTTTSQTRVPPLRTPALT